MSTRKHRGTCPRTVVACALLLCAIPAALTAGSSRILVDLVRGVGKVGEEVPIRQVDEVLEDLSRSGAAREVVDAELRRSGELIESGSKTARSAAVVRLLGKMAEGVEPGVRASLETLDPIGRESVFVIAKGAQEAERLLPDIAQRARFIDQGGAVTLAAIGRHGTESGKAAVRFSFALEAGTVAAKAGQKMPTLADFGRVMARSGAASWEFWKTYIHPHWKIWLASGALAAYLADPERFEDTAGQLTEAGFRHLADFAGRVAAESIRGLGRGSESAVRRVGSAISETYLTGWGGVAAAIGTVAFLLVVGLLFRGIRHRVLRRISWIWEKTVEPPRGYGEGAESTPPESARRGRSL